MFSDGCVLNSSCSTGQGDHISLQGGDMCPARCRVAVGSASGVVVQKGERITLDPFGENATLLTSTLPKGRTTIPSEGDELLTLCNKIQIYVLLESPLQNFLNEPSGKCFRMCEDGITPSPLNGLLAVYFKFVYFSLSDAVSVNIAI